MARKRHTAEQIIGMLREAEVGLAEGNSCDEPTEARRLDRHWHVELLSGCQNRSLMCFLEVLKNRAARYEVAFMREMQRTGSSTSADQHEDIMVSLRGSDLESAATTLEENWRVGPRVLVPWLEHPAAGNFR